MERQSGEEAGKSLEALRALLEDSPNLTVSALSMAAARQAGRPPVQRPIILHLGRIWAEAGLGAREWSQALNMFEMELGGGTHTHSRKQIQGQNAESSEQSEIRWSPETFSIWLMHRGRKLQECNDWFRAFDFDGDQVVGVADFLQGLASFAFAKRQEPQSDGGLCAAAAFYRLLDLGNIDPQSLESVLKVAIRPEDIGLPLAQIAQRAHDFSFLRMALLPHLQASPYFRIHAFGG